MTVRFLRSALRALLVLLWTPSLALAAVTMVAIDATTSVPLSLVIISAGLSSLSGATALVLRIDAELRKVPGAALSRPWLFSAAHMLGSWMAGVLAFLLGQHGAQGTWFGLGLVIVFSFLGAKAIEMVAEKYIGRVLPEPRN